MDHANLADRNPESMGDFGLEDLRVFPSAGRIEGPGGSEQVDPKVMEVFESLARHAGTIVTRDMLLDSVWAGRVVSDDVVTRCIYQLRGHLARAGADRSYSALVKTLPKRGYLLDAPVQPAAETSAASAKPLRRHRAAAVAGLAGLAAIALAWWLFSLSAPDSTTSPAIATPATPTVAVLPFTDLSAESDQAWFADGVADEVIGRLAAYRELRVIGRTSSFALRDSGYGSREISDLLGAQYLLEGSVRKDGDALRISAQLVDRDGVHLWGETFDRELREIFAVQSEIAQVVATSILPRVTKPARQWRHPDVEAYREYLVGRDLLTRRTGMFFDRAPEHFTRAIEIDPAFADAYAARAIGLFFRSRAVGAHDEQVAQAWRDVDTAISLDPDLGQAYAAKALLMERTDPDNYREREALLRHALELDPTLAEAWNWLGSVLLEQERVDEADQALRQGLRQDPLATVINVNLAVNDARKGRPEAGAQKLERLLGLPNPSPMVAEMLVTIYLSSGRFAEALATAKRLVLDVSPAEGRAAWTLPLIATYNRLGMTDLARYWLDRHEAESPPSYYPVTLYVLGQACHALGPEEALLRYRAVMESAGVEPAQLPLGQHADYGRLLSRAGDHARAIAVLEPLLAHADDRLQRFSSDEEAALALAWSWQRTGQSRAAEEMLRHVAAVFSSRDRLDILGFGDELGQATLNAILLGDLESARDYLARAIAAGWRDPHGITADPRWQPALADPFMRGLLDRARSDLERQRAEIETAEDHEAFVRKVDAAIAAGRGGNATP